MAGNAQFRGFVNEEIFFRGSMGVVTTQATLILDNLMDDFFVVGIFLMAREADLISIFLQKIRFIRGMRIVTGSTFAFLNSCMDILQVQLQVLGLVAEKTELIPFFFQDKRRHHSMPEMTVFAFIFRNCLVDILPGKIFSRQNPYDNPGSLSG